MNDKANIQRTTMVHKRPSAAKWETPPALLEQLAAALKMKAVASDV